MPLLLEVRAPLLDIFRRNLAGMLAGESEEGGNSLDFVLQLVDALEGLRACGGVSPEGDGAADGGGSIDLCQGLRRVGGHELSISQSGGMVPQLE